MLPLYAARIEDLGQGDFVKVDCAACHHVALLTPEALLRVGLSRAAKVLDLKGRSSAADAGGKGGPSFRSNGGHKAREGGSPQFVQKRLRLLQIGRVEPLGEPAMDRRKELAGLGAAALVAAQPGEAHGGA